MYIYYVDCNWCVSTYSSPFGSCMPATIRRDSFERSRWQKVPVWFVQWLALCEVSGQFKDWQRSLVEVSPKLGRLGDWCVSAMAGASAAAESSAGKTFSGENEDPLEDMGHEQTVDAGHEGAQRGSWCVCVYFAVGTSFGLHRALRA